MLVAKTDRLAIRYLRPDDLENFFAICGDAETMRFVGDGKPLTREQTASWIEVSINNYRVHGFGCFALTLIGDDRLAGYCGLILPTTDGGVEIIYGIEKGLSGRGLVSEAAGAMLELGFGRFERSEIVATIDPDNLASIRIAEKLGMKFVDRRIDEFGLPELLYSIRSDDGRCRPQAG